MLPNVFDAAIDRMVHMYENHANRIIVSFSAGKDSTCALEVCRIAREITGHPEPIDVMIRDEEIMFPGTYEYAERVYHSESLFMDPPVTDEERLATVLDKGVIHG